MFYCFQIDLILFQNKIFFSKDPFENSILKIIHLESLESESHFLIICNHVLIGLHFSQFSIKIMVLSGIRIQTCGPK